MDQSLTLRSDLEVDLAIIGAGTAGLMLASALCARGQRLRLVVLEPRQITPNPRVWSFAAEPRHALERFVSSRLERVQLLGRDRPLEKTRLDIVHAGDVQTAALDQITAAGHNPIEEGVRIDGLTDTAQGATVQTGLGPIQARCVVDTRPGQVGAVPEGQWTQISWFASVTEGALPPGFALSRAEVAAGNVVMSQSLALRDGTIQVESMGLCRPGEDGGAVKQHLIDRLTGLDLDPDALTLRRAVLPLSMQPIPANSGAILHAPAGAGGLRFGPGLAALQLAEWAVKAAEGFTQTGRLIAPPGPPRSQRVAITEVARQLEASPEQAASWLNQTLEELPADAALRFLSGVPDRWDGLMQLKRRWLKS